MRTVAIYGFSEITRGYINQSSADELWTLNNAYNYGVPMERVTRWYELHQEYQIFHGDKTEIEYYKFLTQKHPFPIYMQEVSAEYPNSVKYPLDAIADVVDGGRYYFTNSIALMVAHAIYEGVDRLELYGIDLAYGTEYSYQKAGTEYLIGVAIGKGIEVTMPPKCPLLDAPIYGYNAHTQTVHKDELTKHREYYLGCLDKIYAEYAPLVERWQAGDADLLPQVAKLNTDIWMHEGAQHAIKSMLDGYLSGGTVTRHVLEREKGKILQKFSGYHSKVNYYNGYINALRNEGKEDPEMNNQYEKNIEYLHVTDGQLQAVKKLLWFIDIRSVDMTLTHSLDSSEGMK